MTGLRVRAHHGDYTIQLSAATGPPAPVEGTIRACPSKPPDASRCETELVTIGGRVPKSLQAAVRDPSRDLGGSCQEVSQTAVYEIAARYLQ
jgi:hypothetical protein